MAAAAAQWVARRVGTMSTNMSGRLRVPSITGEKIISPHTTVTIPVPLLHSSCLPSTVTGATATGSLEEWGSPVLCGRGDRKTKKGKRFRGTYGKARPKKDKMIERFKEKVEVPPSTPWPLPFKLI